MTEKLFQGSVALRSLLIVLLLLASSGATLRGMGQCLALSQVAPRGAQPSAGCVGFPQAPCGGTSPYTPVKGGPGLSLMPGGTAEALLTKASQPASSAINWKQIQGVNFFSANASNAHEMWLNFDPARVDRELGWVRSIGFNSVRLWLSAKAYQSNSKRFLSSLETCLDFCRKHGLTAMLVLFDSCGIEERADPVPMTVNDAYKQFLSSSRFSDGERQLIQQRYREFAEGRGKDMWIKVGRDTPFDVLFWQNWSPNPGLSHLTWQSWSLLEKYVDDVVTIGDRHSEVIAYDLMNEPGCLFDIPAGSTRQAGMAEVTAFLEHLGHYLEQKLPKAARTIGSANLDDMGKWAPYQTLLSVHSYQAGDALSKVLEEASAFARLQSKPILLSECLANTDNWLKVHGEERLSTDEAQLGTTRPPYRSFWKAGWAGIRGVSQQEGCSHRLLTSFLPTDIAGPRPSIWRNN